MEYEMNTPFICALSGIKCSEEELYDMEFPDGWIEVKTGKNRMRLRRGAAAAGIVPVMRPEVERKEESKEEADRRIQKSDARVHANGRFPEKGGSYRRKTEPKFLKSGMHSFNAGQKNAREQGKKRRE